MADTLGFGLSKLSRPSGLAANLTTAFVVLIASVLGLPVSTTHVLVGAIISAGASERQIFRQGTTQVLFAWLITVPAAVFFAWALALSLLPALR
ncbi:MAG: inorganic phosphate transporter [Candidatus Binatia bacterium]|nr:inorganic phosphate transporter [Candidatus Binatia bacterium]